MRLYFCKNLSYKAGKKLRRIDKRRLRKNPSLKHNTSFSSSRAFIARLGLKDNICISHKGRACLVAYSKQRFGVDLEILRKRDFGTIKELCFSQKEIAYASDMLRFYQIFTMKEALLKAKNFGFDMISRVCVFSDSKFKFKSLIVDDEFIISIAYKGDKDVILRVCE